MEKGNFEGPASNNPPALFSTFVMSLASATMVELGLIPDPISKQKRKNIEHARQHIEILNMLKEKTRGNLTPQEVQLLDRALTDLRFEFTKTVSEK